MTNTALKAGAIGGAVAVVVSLISLIPCVGCVSFILSILVYLGTGALAAYWLPAPRETGSAAGAGAIAAVIAGFIGGAINAIIAAIQVAITGSAQMLSQIPPEQLQQLQDAGIDPSLLVGIPGVLICGSGCCLVGLIIAAALGAIGGVVLTAVKKD
jgi:hypothetical protein